MDFVREFKDAHEFKDGWYYRLADGYPWIGPFVTAHMAARARAHVTSHVCAKPEWLKITTSVALGRLSLIPPRGGGPAFQMSLASSRHAIPAAVQTQSTGYQVRPRLALSARRESPAVPAVPAVPAACDESAAPQPAVVPRRRGSRTV